VLGVRGLGVHDRFFEILAAFAARAKLVRRDRARDRLRVPALFADDTVDELARTLRDGARDATA
jgi:hypothetical protein